MSTDTRSSWRAVTVVVGFLYGSVGILFGLPSTHLRFWRLAAWAVSGVVYAGHIAYECYGLKSRAIKTAAHAAIAVAIGAFLLAVWASLHAAFVSSSAPYWRFLIALVAWPIITAVPAFLPALVLGWLLRARAES
jgi:hypothetical protein